MVSFGFRLTRLGNKRGNNCRLSSGLSVPAFYVVNRSARPKKPDKKVDLILISSPRIYKMTATKFLNLPRCCISQQVVDKLRWVAQRELGLPEGQHGKPSGVLIWK